MNLGACSSSLMYTSGLFLTSSLVMIICVKKKGYYLPQRSVKSLWIFINFCKAQSTYYTCWSLLFSFIFVNVVICTIITLRFPEVHKTWLIAIKWYLLIAFCTLHAELGDCTARASILFASLMMRSCKNSVLTWRKTASELPVFLNCCVICTSPFTSIGLQRYCW